MRALDHKDERRSRNHRAVWVIWVVSRFLTLLLWTSTHSLFIADDADGRVYNVERFQYLPEEIDEEIVVIDGLGQTLSLNIENMSGGGGQRRIAVFCNFWLINTTEHCLRYKQEGCKLFVAGTVLSPTSDGSKTVAPSNGQVRASYSSWGIDGAIFSGTPGALASFPGRCDLHPRIVSSRLEKNMSYQQLAAMAFMFNFIDGPVIGIGQQRLSVQLGDGTGQTSYLSDWSRGFSLDSVGITQGIGYVTKPISL